MNKLLKKKVILPIFAIVILVTGSSFKGDFFEIAKQIEIFTTLFKELNMNYVDETNPAELMDTAIKNMLDELDPYTKFLNEQDVEAYKINNAGEYSGIGATVRSYKDKLVIIEPYKDYPADKAGLKGGDEIIKIGDINIADFDDNGSELLKGANNTSVKVTYKRQGETKTATITRAGVEVDAVPFYKMVDDRTGYIVLAKFNAKASSQTKAALIDLQGKGAEKIILDLRGNPGGLLSEAINVTNLFIDKGELIVTTKSKVKKFNREYKTKNKPVDTEIPLVVLVNGSSASASEIVSGSLQDLDRAVVMGQSLDYWNRDENNQAVRNTSFNEFKTRNGRKVEDGGGVLPDIEIEAVKANPLTTALLNNNVIFDFATDYYYKNQVADVSNFKFSDTDFQNFKNFVSQSDFSFETKTEKAIKEAMTNKEDVIFNSTVEEDFKTLLTNTTLQMMMLYLLLQSF